MRNNALSMAAYYLRQPGGHVPGATRKAAQALPPGGAWMPGKEG